jgi:hypothetical protein
MQPANPAVCTPRRAPPPFAPPAAHLAAEAAEVLGVLANFDLLDLLTQRGTVAGAVLADDPDLLRALRLQAGRQGQAAGWWAGGGGIATVLMCALMPAAPRSRVLAPGCCPAHARCRLAGRRCRAPGRAWHGAGGGWLRRLPSHRQMPARGCAKSCQARARGTPPLAWRQAAWPGDGLFFTLTMVAAALLLLPSHSKEGDVGGGRAHVQSEAGTKV